MPGGMNMSIATLQDCLDHDMRIWANCARPNCGHGVELDIAKLIERFGPDYSYIGDDRLRNSLRCARCGHKGGTLAVAHRRLVSGDE